LAATRRIGRWNVQVCFKTKALTFIGDADAESQWEICRQWLVKYGALEAFDRRGVAVGASGMIGLRARVVASVAPKMSSAKSAGL
jgi:hypothetical protein